jgi:hypothetical protein
MRTALAIVMLSSLALVQPPGAVNNGGPIPDGWKVRFDDPAAKPDQVTVREKENALTFATGPAAIYYKPTMKAAGDYELSAVVSQIKTTVRPEGYGLLIGGADLDKDTERYTSFLVRQDGKYSIVSRDGADTKPLVAWTAAPSMHEPSGMKTSNTLLIRAMGNNVRFFIDGKQVHTLSRTAVGGDGIAGVRVGNDLTVQVTNLTLKREA